MTRLIGPDESVRVVYLTVGARKGAAAAQGLPAVIYADAQLSTLADIRTTLDQAISGSTVLIDAYSKIPLFLFPDGVDTVYTSIAGGPATPLYARVDDRLDTVTARVAALESGATVTSVAGRTGAVVLAAADISGVETPTGAQTKATAAQSGAIAVSAQRASNLADLASASAARTNLGLGTSALYMNDVPANHGLVEWNYSLDVVGTSAGSVAAAGTVYGQRIDIQAGTVISNVVLLCGTAAAGLTAGQCVAVVINGSGVELARSGDISGLFGATGVVTIPLLSSFTPASGAKICVLLLFNGATPPGLVRSSATSVTGPNLGLSSTSPRRYFTAGTTQTAVATPITMSGTSSTGALTYWIGLS